MIAALLWHIINAKFFYRRVAASLKNISLPLLPHPFWLCAPLLETVNSVGLH